MSDVVFLGPSLDRHEASTLFSGEIASPICRGDLDALVARDPRPDHVGIVDGAFLHSLSVTPKEVLRAVDAGITVFGSSSMGALRAAECHPYGVIGVGQIFGLYAAGIVEADDEVAIAMSPDSHEPLSEPLVNMRLAVQRAQHDGHLDAHTADALIRTARETYFPERTWAGVLATLATSEDLTAPQHAGATAWVASRNQWDQKADDARMLLALMETRSYTGTLHARLRALPPLATVGLTVGGTDLAVPVANTVDTIRRGLAGRSAIGDGMLFAPHWVGRASMWMKDVLVDLDMVWLRDGVVVDLVADASAPAPGTADSELPKYTNAAPADVVLELPGGRAAELELGPGVPVDFHLEAAAVGNS